MDKRLDMSEIADRIAEIDAEISCSMYDAGLSYNGELRGIAQQIREFLTAKNDEAKQSSGIELIAPERERQINVEGWSSERDDNYTNDELALAASLYAMPQRKRHLDILYCIWPWHFTWWKPSPDNRIRELAKAGALIAAEIDRLKRSQKNVP